MPGRFQRPIRNNASWRSLQPASLPSGPRFCEERGIVNGRNHVGSIMQKAARIAQARNPDDPFEDHCWKDIIPADVIELYSNYRREVGVGPSPALVAIDLYELVYQGGAKPVPQVMKAYPNSCGEHAWAAIAPTKRLLAAARAAGLPVFYSTGDTRPQSQPKDERRTLRTGR